MNSFKCNLLFITLTLLVLSNSALLNKQSALTPDNTTNTTIDITSSLNTTNTTDGNLTSSLNATNATDVNNTNPCIVSNCSCVNGTEDTFFADQGYCPSNTAACFNQSASQCGVVNGICGWNYNSTDLVTCLNNNNFCTKRGCDEKQCLRDTGVKDLTVCPVPAANFTQCYDRASCLVNQDGDCGFTPQLPLYMCLNAYGYFAYKTSNVLGTANMAEFDNFANNATISNTGNNITANVTIADLADEIGDITSGNIEVQEN